MPKAMIMAGGTGGHVFPALAVAEALRQQGWDVAWLGTAERLEAKIVPQHGFPLHFLPVKGLRGKGLLNRIASLWGVVKSIFAARKVLKQHQSEIVFGFGGYPSFPGGVAAKLLGIPLLIHEQNAIPGLTNKLLGRLANEIFVGFPQAKTVFEEKGLEARFVGNPIRTDIEPALERDEREVHNPFRLLIVGGSLGARPLNEQVPDSVKSIKDIEIFHQCGANDLETVTQKYQQYGVAATIEPFINDMAKAYAWADAIVCRAGALTVAEVAQAGLAACFVPLPHAVDDHQTHNANYLASQGAGVVLPQSQLKETLTDTLVQWVDDPTLSKAMGQKASSSLPGNATEVLVAACQKYSKE